MNNIKPYIIPATTVYSIEESICILAGTDRQQSTKNVREVEDAELGISSSNLWDEEE